MRPGMRPIAQTIWRISALAGAVPTAHFMTSSRPSLLRSLAAWRDGCGAMSRVLPTGWRILQELRHGADAAARIPKYVLRNYLAQQAIEALEQGDASVITRLMEVLQRPYDEQPEHEELADRRPEWARNKPGCSALSCSS